MRKMYCGYVSLRILYSERGECEIKKRNLEWVCCRLYPFILLDNKRKDLEISLVDVAHIG
jgi:hypothetical protein